MKIYSSQTPAQNVGKHISDSMAHHSGDVLCLLAGGSALEVIPYITLPPDNAERRTIFMMGDERWSREPELNNYLQLANRFSDSSLLEHTIATVPEPNETHIAFTKRIRNTIQETLATLSRPKIIALLGVGTDGHTASIFPMEWEDFQETYMRADPVYVRVHSDAHEPPERATFTPQWLMNEVHEMIVYVTGEEKDHVLFSFVSDQKSLHERPIELVKTHIHAHVYTDIDLSS